MRLDPDQEPTLVDRCRALQTRMRHHHFFSHETAAQLYGLPLPRSALDVRIIHVTSLAPHPAIRRAGVIGHQLGARNHGTTLVHGLRVTEPLEVWRQLGARLSVDDLVVVGDALVRRKLPLVSLEELRLATESAAGRPGSRRLRSAISWVRTGVDSPMESRLRLRLRDAGLPEPLVNGTITDAYGEFVALGDLVYPEYRIVVEYDGGHHRTIESQYHHDVDREYAIRAAGWDVIRVNKTHLKNRAAVAVARVRAALRSRFVKND
jgi:very-short-patch-repair endonuclease